MTRLVGAEFLKLRTTAASWVLPGARCSPSSRSARRSRSRCGTDGGAVDGARGGRASSRRAASSILFALLARRASGSRTSSATERSRRRSSSTPTRERVLAAKLVAFALVGLVLGAVLAIALTLAIAAPVARGAAWTSICRRPRSSARSSLGDPARRRALGRARRGRRRRGAQPGRRDRRNPRLVLRRRAPRRGLLLDVVGVPGVAATCRRRRPTRDPGEPDDGRPLSASAGPS